MTTRANFPKAIKLVLLSTSAAILLLAGGTGISAVAKETSAAAAALTTLKTARQAKDEAAIVTAIDGLVSAHNTSENKKERAKVQSAIGGLLTAKALPDARGHAAFALGKLNDSEGAFKQLKGVLPTAKTKPGDNFSMAVLTALETLKPEAAVAPLIKLVGATKEPTILARAARALGVHTDSKKRPQIAQALLARLAKGHKTWLKAEKSKAQPDAKLEKQAVWVNAAPAIGEALDALTGRKITDPAKWLAAYAEVKNKAAALFPTK